MMNTFSPLSAILLYVLIRQFFIAKREGRPIHAKNMLATLPFSLTLFLANFIPFSNLLALIMLLFFVASIFYNIRTYHLTRTGRLRPDNKISTESSYKFAVEATLVLVLLFTIKTIWGKH